MEMAVRNPKVGLLNTGYDAGETQTEDEITEYNLHQCARMGDVHTLSQLLSQRHVQMRVNELDEDGLSPLHYAARSNQFEAVRVLVEKGKANASVRDEDGATPLHYAARKRQRGQSKESVDLIHYLAYLTDANIRDTYQSTPLHFAAMRGNEVAARALLECEGIDVDAADQSGGTPLHETATYNQVGVAVLLLQHGAKVYSFDKDQCSPLHLACAGEDNSKMVKLLLERVENNKQAELISAKDSDQNTALHLAIDARNVPAVKSLLKRGADLNAPCRLSSVGYTPLHLASIAGNPDVVKLLVDNGARILARDAGSATPLHRAVEYQNEEVVKMIIKKLKSPPDSKDGENYTPLLSSACYANSRITSTLLNNGADMAASDRHDRTALHLAALYNQTDAVKTLLKSMRNFNEMSLLDAEDRIGETALHVAAKQGATDIAEQLLEMGADMTSKNEEEETPFLLAAKAGQTEVVEMFIRKSEKVLNDQDEYSNTALHLAADGGFIAIVTMLVETGADKEARNNKSWTPLDLASSKGHDEVVKYLLSEDVKPNPSDKEKTPPLVLAAKGGHDAVVRVLIESGADVTALDSEGRNCLDLAIDQGHRNVAAAIVQSSKWRMALMHQTDTWTEPRNTPMRKLIRKMPDVAQLALTRCISYSADDLPTYDYHYYIEFNFTFMDDTYFDYDKESVKRMDDPQGAYDNLYGSGYPYDKDLMALKANHPLMIMVDKKREDLLAHPLMIALARHKWNVARSIYFSFLVFYAVFLGFISAYMISSTPPSPFPEGINLTECEAGELEPVKGSFLNFATFMVPVLAGIGIVLELIQIVTERWLYINPLNTLDWFAYVSAILVVIDYTECGARNEWQWQLGAFTVFVAWINMMMFARRLPGLGLYTVMVTEILITFSKFFTVFLLFIIAFALSFFLLLQNQAVYSTPFYAIIKTWTMLLGEFDYADLFHGEDGGDPDDDVVFEGVTYTIFVVFLVLMAIIIMNLLVGLAVDDVGELQRHAKLRKLAMQLELALDIELSMPRWLRKYFEYSVAKEKLYPNRKSFALKHLFQKMMDGPIMNKDKLFDYIRNMQDESSGSADVEATVHKYMRMTKKNFRDLNDRLDKLEAMLADMAAGRTPRRVARPIRNPDVTTDSEAQE